MSKSKNKYYVVWVGQNPGIYTTWAETKLQISGFPKAKYKGFKTKEEAEEAFKSSATEYIGKKKEKSVSWKKFEDEIELNSICVDAACSGNPGQMEFRGVITTTGEELFKKGPYIHGTNNIGEYLALVQALAFLKKLNKPSIKIYSDSRTAMAWVRNKKVKTTLKKSSKNEKIFELLDKAVKWINDNTYETEILKWDTKRWGEIPADFGRK